jgi:spore cortex formation protein SpoVR/YcgB (stage V sporulation)
MSKKSKLMYTDAEWTFERLDIVYEEIRKIAEEELKLSYYENQIEIISSEQMLDAYTSVGMPMMYNHWSFGKSFVQQQEQYKRGQMGLAYEIVINSDPCISYCMEENTMTMQTLVIAHAAFGHNFFFKNNYLFKEWTDAKGIIPYLSFAKKYIAECEEKYGEREVEKILNSCHALQSHGVNRYKRPAELSIHEEKAKQKDREEFLRQNVNHLWDRITNTPDKDKQSEINSILPEPEENILYFLEKHSPVLESWQRELVRIVRKVAQYFYPQAQTKVMNEGCATYVHYYIMNRLYDKGLIDDGHMKEFLISHTGVTFQPDYDDAVVYKDANGEEQIYSRYSGINPYALGFDMFRDIERICKNPTEEDKYHFPDIAGADFIETFHYAVENFRDESFIRQFLSPELVRKWKMFVMSDDADSDKYQIDAIQSDEDFEEIRNALANKYTIANYVPEIKVTDVDLKGDRTITLTHTSHNEVLLDKDSVYDVMRHLYRLWGHNIIIESYERETGEFVEEYLTNLSDEDVDDGDDPF